MKLPAKFSGLDQAGQNLPSKPVHLAIGMFDGVHLGHQAVIDAARISAEGVGGLVGVLTFDPHPSRLFRPSDPVRLLQMPEEKERMLLAQGIDFVVTQPFNAEFAAIEANAFVPWLQMGLPRLAAVYVGENWRYGRGRTGDVDQLLADARSHGVSVVSAPRIKRNGETISSTRIRADLTAGRISEVNGQLGYRYRLDGEVTPGKALGRTVGFPTLNLPWRGDLQPRLGVYAVQVSARGGKERLPGVANFGLRPTVEDAVEPRLETHLLGDCPFGPGDVIRVELRHFLRAEQKFAGIEALRAQIEIDRKTAADFFLQ